MRQLLIAAVLVAAFPASALGAGLAARDLSPQAPRRAVPTGVFELAGVHWRGPGLVKYRTRNLAGRWSAWRLFSPEDAFPDRGREQGATRGWRIASPFWTGPSNAIQYRTVGRVSRLRAYFVRSPRERPSAKRADLAGAPAIITRAGWHADESIRRAPPEAQLRTIATILGIDSARSFYFAVQQLFVLGGVGKLSRPMSCRCPSPKISNSCDISQS